MFGKLDMVKLAERQKGLQFFLDILMESSPVMWQPETLSFLGVANTHLDFLGTVSPSSLEITETLKQVSSQCQARRCHVLSQREPHQGARALDPAGQQDPQGPLSCRH